MTSVFLYFQNNSNILFNNYVRLYRVLDKFLLKYEEGRGVVQIDPTQKKLPSKSAALLWL